jgi:putative ABC transport system permease protein
VKIVLKTIIRNFIHRPAINLINLFGLSISLSIVIILSVYCYSELTTDRFHENSNDVYLLKKGTEGIYLPGILSETIIDKVPGLKSVVRIAPSWEAPVFKVENKEPITTDMIFADEDFFELFTYKTSEGDIKSALNEPMSVVITENLASKLFGEEKALGKSIILNNKKNLIVSAVIKEQENNTCLNFSALTSIATRKIIQSGDDEFKEWGWNNFQIFLLLEKTINPVDVIKNIIRIIPENEQKYYSGANLVSLRKLYFSKFSLFGSEYLVSGNKKKVIVLLMVAILVMTIALINYINISTSQWQERVKETGILKVLGASRSEITRNILTESFIFFLASMIIAIQLAISFSPFIRDFTGIKYNERLTGSPAFFILSVIVILLLSIIFSILPALRISSSRAVDNLKKTIRKNTTNYSVNGVMVTMQFSIAIALIAFTILVQKQVRFGTNNLGMNQDNIIGIKFTEELHSKKDILKERLEKESAIKEISLSQYFPGKVISSWGTKMILNGESIQIQFNTFNADAEFFKMMGLELISGKFYSDDLSSDNDKIIVNEAFLRKHNLSDPIGGTILVGMMGQPVSHAEIVGIVKDFHYKPVNKEIEALVISLFIVWYMFRQTILRC